MTFSLLAQYIIITLAVLVSAAVVMRKQFPNATRKLRIACALPFLREGRPVWVKSVGRRIAPPARGNAANCAGCDNCD